MVPNRYIVTLNGHQTRDGSFAADASAAAVRRLVRKAGGSTVASYRQIGVVIARSDSRALASVLGASPLVQTVGHDFGVKVFAARRGERSTDPLEGLQWDMAQIRTQQAHAVQPGRPAVDVGVLDSGVDSRHVDFTQGVTSRVDCTRGHDSLAVLPPGTAVGSPEPCPDNQFHGTHVAGTIGARVNSIGVAGVAPHVTLVPIKTCDSSGFCYVSPVIDAITYSGDIELDVINMSIFVDNDDLQESTEFKCTSDPTQMAFRQSIYRAIQYARGQSVVPAENRGVISVSALGPDSGKSSYSNYGAPRADIAAPGGDGTTGDCETTILSTLPGNGYGCIQGTSMAPPHAAGVAALIVSQSGRLGADGDMKMSPVRWCGSWRRPR
jgi:subtilisin family serine protease